MNNEVFVPRIQITVTSRCTLKCKNCCNGCHYWDKTDKSNDLTKKEIKKTFDALFSKVKYVNNIKILGGEPFLCQDTLSYMLMLLKKRYKNRYFKITIDTNATIIPSKKIIDILKRDNITLCVSDYRHSVKNLSNKYGELISTLKKEKIKFVSYHEINRWKEHKMFETKDDREDITKKIRRCFVENKYFNSPEIHIDKMYLCAIGYNKMRSLKMDTSNIYCLDLSNISSKEEILKYYMALDEKWTFQGCRYCNGLDSDFIVAAIQEGD